MYRDKTNGTVRPHGPVSGCKKAKTAHAPRRTGGDRLAPRKGRKVYQTFPSMRNVKIRRNQSRGGTPCPPEGRWFVKLFPAVRILENQNRRNVCPCRTGLRREQAPALRVRAHLLFPAQPGRVSLPNCARAGTETRPYGSRFYFHHSRNVCPCQAVYGRRRGLPLRVLTSDI